MIMTSRRTTAWTVLLVIGLILGWHGYQRHIQKNLQKRPVGSTSSTSEGILSGQLSKQGSAPEAVEVLGACELLYRQETQLSLGGSEEKNFDVAVSGRIHLLGSVSGTSADELRMAWGDIQAHIEFAGDSVPTVERVVERVVGDGIVLNLQPPCQLVDLKVLPSERPQTLADRIVFDLLTHVVEPCPTSHPQEVALLLPWGTIPVLYDWLENESIWRRTWTMDRRSMQDWHQAVSQPLDPGNPLSTPGTVSGNGSADFTDRMRFLAKTGSSRSQYFGQKGESLGRSRVDWACDAREPKNTGTQPPRGEWVLRQRSLLRSQEVHAKQWTSSPRGDSSLGIAKDWQGGFAALKDAQRSADRDRESQAFRDLKRFMMVEPFDPALRAYILGLDSSHPDLSLWIRVASAAGSKDCQEILRRLLQKHRGNDLLVRQLIPGMSMAPRPELANFRELLASGENPAMRPAVRTLAWLGIGIMVGQWQAQPADERPAEFNDALAILHKQLGARQDLASQQLYLSALGNMRSNEALTILKPYLHHEQISLRQGAVMALRLIPDQRAAQWLLERATYDSEPEVRKAAARAFAYRPMTVAWRHAWQQLQMAEKDMGVRQAIDGLISNS